MPFGEEDDCVLGPTTKARWSYACSKAIDEYLALAYHREKGMPAIVARLFNTVGPRQVGRYGMVVPRFVRAALDGNPLEVYGTGQQTRCFCHVADVVGALSKLMECDQAIGQVVNIGTTESCTIQGLAEKIIAMTGSSSEIRRLTYEQAYGRPFDDMLIRQPDLAKIQRLIEYEPRFSLTDALQSVIDHERARGSASNDE